MHLILCQLAVLHCYFCITTSVLVDTLWVTLVSLVSCSTAHVSPVICRVLQSGQSVVILHVHGICMFATFLAVFVHMPWAVIQARGMEPENGVRWTMKSPKGLSNYHKLVRCTVRPIDRIRPLTF